MVVCSHQMPNAVPSVYVVIDSASFATGGCAMKFRGARRPLLVFTLTVCRHSRSSRHQPRDPRRPPTLEEERPTCKWQLG